MGPHTLHLLSQRLYENLLERRFVNLCFPSPLNIALICQTFIPSGRLFAPRQQQPQQQAPHSHKRNKGPHSSYHHPPPRASFPPSLDPASHPYPTSEQTPVRSRDIHNSVVKIPERELFSVELIYYRRAAFTEDMVLFDDVLVEVEDRLHRSYLFCLHVPIPPLRE